MFFSLQELVHDRGVVCHSGVICIHCCHLDDRGPCGERIQGCCFVMASPSPHSQMRADGAQAVP